MSGEFVTPLRAPYPYFGGKRRAANLVWRALGNVDHYIEPFCGSAAVLLARPHVGRCETMNDADGLLSNFWRAVRASPDEVAHHADWPVLEVDLHARHRWLIGQRANLTVQLESDPEFFDAKAAGWWVWGACAWIGDGWCGEKAYRKLPNLAREGGGILAPSRQTPHLSNEGMGIHAPRRGAAFSEEAMPFTTTLEWFRALSERLRPVRAASGDWRRVVASPSMLIPTSLPKRAVAGIYFDPPYADGVQQYAVGGTGTTVSADVRAWCEEHGNDPRLRIVLSGYEGEHDVLVSIGWRSEAWRSKGGYAAGGSGDNANQKRERLWFSPACLGDEALPLFGGGAR